MKLEDCWTLSIAWKLLSHTLNEQEILTLRKGKASNYHIIGRPFKDLQLPLTPDFIPRAHPNVVGDLFRTPLSLGRGPRSSFTSLHYKLSTGFLWIPPNP